MLTIEQANIRQQQLEQLLREMSQSCMDTDELIRPVVLRLRELYTDNFRHSYSTLFPLLVEIAGDDNMCSLEYLSTSMVTAREFVDRDRISGAGEYTNLYKPLMKLSDHLNLEIARYLHFFYQDQQIKDLEQDTQELQSELNKKTEELLKATANLTEAKTLFDEAEKKLKAIENQFTEAGKKLSSIQIDIIAVLSIFASIVLTFSGSMTVLGSALTGMQEVHALKATFFVLLCGFVLGNIIFLLMYLVGKLTSRNIYARCKTENCTCNPPCNGFTRIRKRLPYIFWLNLILIVLMVVVVVIWYLDNHYHFIH